MGASFEVVLLALQVEEEGNKPRNAAASRSWKGKGNRFPFRASGRNAAC